MKLPVERNDFLGSWLCSDVDVCGEDAAGERREV